MDVRATSTDAAATLPDRALLIDQHGSGFARFPRWMWRNTVVADLATWPLEPASSWQDHEETPQPYPWAV